jgi:hypothetical protein
MEDIGSLNLMRFLDFYFALIFCASTWRRLGQYSNVGKLVLAGPGRWPHLLKLLKQYRTILWTWSMILPALLALAIWIAQVLASRLVFPEASTPPDGLSLGRLLEHWPALLVAVPLGFATFAFDLYSLYVVGGFDREAVEKHLDQAEYWLRSRSAHVVRVVSFGIINPRRMVAEEVEKALVGIGDMLNFTLWWITVQMGIRLAFGLTLWITWALTR